MLTIVLLFIILESAISKGIEILQTQCKFLQIYLFALYSYWVQKIFLRFFCYKALFTRDILTDNIAIKNIAIKIYF